MDWDIHRIKRWALVLVAALFTNSAWSALPTTVFHIPGGPASETLLEFGRQADVRVLYTMEAVQGIQTQDVSGQMEASEALAQMLRGTGLICVCRGDFAGIKRAEAAPAPHADTTPSAPGEGPSIPVQSEIEEVLVTGSLIHGVSDITSPLVSVERTEMKRTAYASVQDAVRALSMAAILTRGEIFQGVGNFNRGAGINLRGLGDGATLVLVNGRRQPSAGTSGDFVDVSTIPWSMVERIEVLPDGGSALYGSDALAGVVNILLRDDAEGVETQLRYGAAVGGGAELLASQMIGNHWDSGQWLVGYQYYERASLSASDRDFAANADKRALGGRDFRSIRGNPGNILDPQTLQPIFGIPRGQDGTSLSSGDLLPGVINYRNQFAGTQLLPDKLTHNLYFTASQHMSERWELFAEGRYAQRDTCIRPSLPDEGSPSPLLLIPATNPFFVDPLGGSPFVIVAYDFTDELGPFRERGRTRSYVSTLGLKGKFNGRWQASLSASHGAEDLHWKSFGEVDPLALAAAVADSDPATAFNPFGDGVHTNPTTIQAIAAATRRSSRSEISSIQLMGDGPLLDLPSGTAKVAIGTEYRDEDLSQHNDFAGFGLVPSGVHIGRKIAAVFAELSVPLMGNPADPSASPRLDFSLAGRYEHYDDFGRTYNPKVGIHWSPLQSMKLRASWGTSFRAPNLVDLDDSRNVSGLASLQDPRSPTGRSDMVGVQGGNPELKEERATTWTAGLDLAPEVFPGFQLSLTAYAINVEDQVIQPGPLNVFDILLEEDQWAAVITRNPSQSQVDAICQSPHFLFGSPEQCRTNPPAVLIDFRKHNLAITKVKGLDLTLRQSFSTDVGRFDVELNGARVFYFKRAFTTAAPVVDIVNTVNSPLGLRLRGTVEWHQRGRQLPGFGANLTANYTGGYSDRDSPERHSVEDWTTFDFGLNYRTGKHGAWTDETEVVLNIANVLNEDPPFVDREWGYDFFNAQPMGRVLSLYVSKSW